MTTEATALTPTATEPNWVAPAVPLPIESHEDYVQVAGELKAVKEFEKRVVGWFKPLKERAHAAWKGITEREKETLAPARDWETRCKLALAAWDEKQERIRREEQRRLEEEARKQEEARRVADAAAMEAEGIAEGDTDKLEEAERILDEPVETPVVMVEKETPKVDGISYREKWDAKVVDIVALARFVAENPSHQNLLQPNTTALRSMARSLKANMRIPGVKVYSERVVAAR